MAYKALYRTYRPQVFNDVVGQEAVVKTLQNAIINNKISHAYLFSGPRGTGKTSIARIFAKALNCTNVKNGEPCDECDSCREISEGISPDVIEIDAASNNGVDEIRDIREKVKYLPSGAKYKVYIIDEVHMLSGGAFNALLKTLEEPPKHVIFILATTEPQKLPATIISRCQRYEFKSLTTVEINYELKKICESEKVTISEEAVNAISEAAEGAMRDALSILDQAISYGNKNIIVDDINVVTGTLSLDKVIGLATTIESKDVHSTLEIINELLLSGKEISKIVDGLLIFYRDLILYQSVGAENLNKYIFSKEQFQEIASKIATQKVMYFIDVLSDIQTKVKNTTTPNVFLEIALIKMCNISVEELDVMKRLAELEEKFNNLNMDGVMNTSNDAMVDNEKVTMLETRINQITAELSRLELRKQIDKLNDLQAKINYNMTSHNSDETTNSEIRYLKDKISELEMETKELHIDELDELKETIKNLQNSTSSGCLKDITERISKLENQDKIDLSTINKHIEEIENKLVVTSFENVNINEISKKIASLNSSEHIDANKFNEKINELDNIINKTLKTKVSQIEEENYSITEDLDQIKTKVVELENKSYDRTKEIVSLDADVLNEISDKMLALEKKVYQIMAGELAAYKTTKKEIKKNNGQIMLFGNDILGIEDYEINAKEKYDFGDLQSEPQEQPTNKEEAVQSIGDSIIKAEIESNNFSYNSEETKEPLVSIEPINITTTNNDTFIVQNEKVEESKEVDIVDEDSMNADNKNEEIFNAAKEVEIVDKPQEDTEEKVGLFETASSIIDRPAVEKKSNNVVSQFFDSEKGEEVINKELSSIVVKKKTNETYELEKDLIARETAYDPFYSKAPVPETENNNIIHEEEHIGDKFATYNIKYIEQILHDSRAIEARNDKARIEQIWKVMNKGARPENFTIIETLQEGKVVAVGNKEFIIVFSSVELCNQVMRARFKDVALRILYELLGDRYNYVALPIDAWTAKSVEYKQQYQIGTKFPTLTPLNIKGLEILSNDEEYRNDKEQAIDQTIKMFGNDVKIE